MSQCEKLKKKKILLSFIKQDISSKLNYLRPNI